MKNILVVYYSQTGQLRDILNSVLAEKEGDNDISVDFCEIEPDPPFPFPWSSVEFFQTMPESVKGIPCDLKPLNIDLNKHYDLIIIGWQPWYLSPSMPLHAFFQCRESKKILQNKPVVTICGARNMWVSAFDDLKKYFSDSGAKLVGNIVLQDNVHNLISVITIIKWLIGGKKVTKFWPSGGVNEQDIRNAVIFGKPIKESVKNNDYSTLQNNLLKHGAIKIKPAIIMMERNAKRIFNIWADFVLKKGKFRAPERNRRVNIFKYYLLFVLFVVSPFASLIFYLTWPLRINSIRKQRKFYSKV